MPTQKSNTEATARPWKSEGAIVVSAAKYRKDCVVANCSSAVKNDKESLANAELIVKSMNEHDALNAVAEAAAGWSRKDLKKALANLAAIRAGGGK